MTWITHVDDDFIDELEEVAQKHQWHNMPVNFGTQRLEIYGINFHSADAIVVLEISQCLVLFLGWKLLSGHLGLLGCCIRHDVWYDFVQGRSNQELHVNTHRYCQRSAVAREQPRFDKKKREIRTRDRCKKRQKQRKIPCADHQRCRRNTTQRISCTTLADRNSANKNKKIPHSTMDVANQTSLMHAGNGNGRYNSYILTTYSDHKSR
jgi:hypothetical protein